MSRLLLAAVTAAVVCGPASADFPFGLFKRKPKAEPTAAKAKQHSTTLAGSPDEAARKQAAEELRTLDPRQNAEVMPALMGAIQKDPSPAVRVAAAESIGRLKPVYQPAGLVLEVVAKADPDAGVRDAAQNALLAYHLGGYTTPPSQRAAATAEPPLAKKPSAGGMTFKPVLNVFGRPPVAPPTAEPPLAKKPEALPPPAPAGVPQPMPATLPPPAPAAPPAPSVPTGPLPPIGN